MKLRLVLGLSAILALGIWVGTAGAAPPPPPPDLGVCGADPGAPLSGTHNGNLTITGNAYVPPGESFEVNGNLTIAQGACFDAIPATGPVVINGNVSVRKRGSFGIGFFFDTGDVVNGNINAEQALTIYIDWTTVHGSIVSNGGGDATMVDSPGMEDGLVLPIKDNHIDGNVVVQGWAGAWAGLIRNTVGGNVNWSKNTGARVGEIGPDSNEVATNEIGGNLICHGNTPAAQIGDSGGSLNVVHGKAIGECSTLVG
jgi:hypothetical protein